MSDQTPTVAKPDELLALHEVTTELFDTLRAWFDVPATVSIDLAAVDSAVRELGNPEMVAALAMRKLQALNLLATPGVRTTTDVVVAIVNDLDRALVQAPSMRLKRQAETTDWDAALQRLDPAGAAPGPPAPSGAEDADPEIDRFRELHDCLHEAAIAVLRASGGEVRIFE